MSTRRRKRPARTGGHGARPGRARLNLVIDEELKAWAKAWARANSTSLTEMIESDLSLRRRRALEIDAEQL